MRIVWQSRGTDLTRRAVLRIITMQAERSGIEVESVDLDSTAAIEGTETIPLPSVVFLDDSDAVIQAVHAGKVSASYVRELVESLA